MLDAEPHATETAMRATHDLLIDYARAHRDERNIASHFVGVPMIVLAAAVLLAKPAVVVGGIGMTPAWIAFACAAAWYLSRAGFTLGLAVSAGVGALTLAGEALAQRGTASWLATGLGLLGLGSLIQAAGHWYEGRKPAFLDDAAALWVAPVFVTAEAMFGLGWNPALRDEIVRRAGPTTLRDLARIA